MEPSSLPPETTAVPPSSPAPEQPARKLFVGGISSETGEAALAEYFGRYGEVREVAVMRDRVTGNARGFGFVQFADPAAAESALEEAKHIIRDKIVEVKRAIPRGEHQQNRQYQNPHHTRGGSSSSSSNSDTNNGSNRHSKKIFIGGLPHSVTQHELKNYFESFGSVIDAVVMYDNSTQRPRGFGFVTFSSEESVAMVLQNRCHELNGKSVDVKVAVPKDDNNYAKNRNYYYYHNSRTTGGGGPVYDTYQSHLYPTYGYYGYYAVPPSSPYLHGGGYNMNGWHGIGYGGPYGTPSSPWNDSRGMFMPDGGFGSSMPVITGGYAQHSESDGNNENQGAPDLQIETVGRRAESHVEGEDEAQVEGEDGKCDTL